MYSIASSASFSAPSPYVAAAPSSNTMRELFDDEIHLVGGAFSYAELYGSVFAGAVAGGVGGLVVGGFVGVGTGALIGAVGGGVGYLAYEAWVGCFG